MMKRDLQRELMEIFEALLAFFGPRNWWPGETPLEVIVGAILTQNVSWDNVEKAIGNLKERGLLSMEGLVGVPVEELAMLIRPTRYYNQKAARLKGFVELVDREFNCELDELFSLDTDRLRSLLLGLKGIGKETADSILLYAANRPVFVVDAYTRRIFSRLGYLAEDAGYDDVQQLFAGNLPSDTYLFNEYHALIVELGKHICLNSSPRCDRCPIDCRCQLRDLKAAGAS